MIVNLEEIQTSGAVLESEVPMPMDAHLEIRCGAAYFAGKVTKAEEHGFGWRIAVELSPLTPWSVERFRPEHLFDPSEMVRGAGEA